VIAGSSPEGAEAVTDAQVFLLNARDVRDLAQADPQVCWPLAQQVAAIAFETADVLGASLFGTVRQSMGRHLLNLASSDGESLFVEIEQQELADMIGTVREVVSRTLRQLQDEGLVRRNGHRVTLLDTDRLSRGL
jgi:CRP-like cAMP-binding protein